MLLIDDLLFSPLTGFKFILKTLERIAEEQYTDDAPLKERLLELQVQLEGGDLSEKEYVKQEAAILSELREIQNRKREMAGLPPQGSQGPLSGKLQEGSGVSVDFSHRER